MIILKPFKEATVDELAKHVKEGKSTGEIAKLYANTTRDMVYNKLKRSGIYKKSNEYRRIDWPTVDPIIILDRHNFKNYTELATI